MTFARHDLGAGIGAVISSRRGGVSTGEFAELNLGASVGDAGPAVTANRAALLRGLADDAGPDRLAWMHQVHGAKVADRTARARPVGEEADAMFTDVPGLALAVLVADCAPVLLAAPAAGLVGVAHAGRPGLAAGVVPALVTAMTKAGAEPSLMVALVGPMICGNCYEVPADMRAEVAALAPGSACETRKGTPGIDIRAGLHYQLAQAGVGSVSDDLRCTGESAELYSYRRDGRTGRFAGLIWLQPR